MQKDKNLPIRHSLQLTWISIKALTESTPHSRCKAHCSGSVRHCTAFSYCSKISFFCVCVCVRACVSALVCVWLSHYQLCTTVSFPLFALPSAFSPFSQCSCSCTQQPITGLPFAGYRSNRELSWICSVEEWQACRWGNGFGDWHKAYSQSVWSHGGWRVTNWFASFGGCHRPLSAVHGLTWRCSREKSRTDLCIRILYCAPPPTSVPIGPPHWWDSVSAELIVTLCRISW